MNKIDEPFDIFNNERVQILDYIPVNNEGLFG